MKNPNPLEKEIEKCVSTYAKSLGILSYKFTSPSRAHVPDRIFFLRRGACFLVEFKRKGKSPTSAQCLEISKLRQQGVAVYVVDNVEDGKKVVEVEKAMSDPAF